MAVDDKLYLISQVYVFFSTAPLNNNVEKWSLLSGKADSSLNCGKGKDEKQSNN